ncbi:site-2 protease family protein [Dactylosporangium sp. NPDC005555]|uniref:site-2 protease family protein n=1 Tax=Dactylosporangium sp. NPDC005555 TaxID=3154889 RepID=UPI0033A1CFD7
MKQTLRLGRVAGFAVGVHWSVLVIMVLLAQSLATGVLPARAPGTAAPVAWPLGAAGAVLFLVSLLAHELAHALVARHFGVRVQQVTLWLLGGMAEFRDEPPSARADLLMAGAGPLTSVAAGVGFGSAAVLLSAVRGPVAVVVVLLWLAMINLILAGFNLLPGAPLDGGRILRAALWWRHGDRARAALTAARAGHVLGLTLVLAGLAELMVFGMLDGVWTTLVGWFLVVAAAAEGTAARSAGGAQRRQPRTGVGR